MLAKKRSLLSLSKLHLQILFATTLIHAIGCTSMRQVPLSLDLATGQVAQPDSLALDQALLNLMGKDVRVVCKDSRAASGRLMQYDGQTLVVESEDINEQKETETIDRSDVLSIEQREFSGGKTTLFFVVLTVVLTVGALFASFLSGLSHTQ